MTRGLADGADIPVSAMTALDASAAELPELSRAWQLVIDHVWNSAYQMLEAVINSHPDISDQLIALDAMRNELSEAFREKVGRPAPPSLYRVNPTAIGSRPTEVWMNEARTFVARLRNESPPWTEGRRNAWKGELYDKAQMLMSTYDATVRNFAEESWHRMRIQGAKQAASIATSAVGNCPQYFLPATPVGPRVEPIGAAEREAVGPGPLNVFIGYLCPGTLTFSTTSYGGFETATEQYELPSSLGVPVVIDLDRNGALLVDDRRCIEGPVLNLLGALPANQFLLKIFDPEHGGDSARFLFGLGEAGERIIGDRVRTSDRELSDLLQTTEEHITYVTQRFLQGEHETLTDYNRAAGEVAEPYQLLVLYDFPSGFVRAGRFDDDQLNRLAKIIRNGPRTGVFTILVSSADALKSGLQPPDGQPHESFASVLKLVPRFLTGTCTPWMLHIMGSEPCNVKFWTSVEAPKRAGAVATLSDATMTLSFVPAMPPDDAVAAGQLAAVRLNIASSSDVQVTPTRVAELAEQAQRSDPAAVRVHVAYPERPETWWRATSERAVAAHFGRIGSRQVADLVLGSDFDNYSALIGGRPGSGKSVLIHSIIMSITIEYPPSEVELYLIDFKEGVEFKQYADIGLPHAKVIAIESERDFGLSVLRRAASEIKRRGELFRHVAQGSANLADYRARTGQPLKRLVLIIDEFQQLFYRDDRLAAESAEILELILRTGRAFGIHLVLASQSLAGLASLGRHVLGMIPTRIALQSNESDSRMILGEDNPDASTLVRAGEGILNRKGGLKDANQRFQAAFWDTDARSALLHSVVRRAHAEGLPNITTVFEGHKPADVTALDHRSLVPAHDAGFSGVAVPVGLPLTLDPEPLFARLKRQSGAHLLVIDELAHGTVAVAIASLVRQGVTVDLFDFVGDDDTWAPVRDHLDHVPGVRLHGRRTVVTAMTEIAAEVDRRHSLNDFKDTPRVIVIAGMGRARDFDPDNSYNEEAPSHLLGRILRDGPEVGVFVVVWFDRPAAVNKRVDRQQLGEFGHRLLAQVSRDDSSMLIDSDSAAGLKAGQGVLADVDKSTENKIRMFSAPGAAWLARFSAGTG